MDSKKYLRILGIVTVLLIGVGILRNIVLPMFGSGAVTASLSYRPQEEDASFSGIRADLETASLTIRTGTEFQVLTDVYRTKEPEIAVRDGYLHITQKDGGGWSLFHLIGTKKCDITVTVPEGMIDRIEVDSDVGEVSVEGLQLEALEIDTDVGEVTIRDVDAEKLIRAKTAVGAIDLHHAAGGDTLLESDVGSITAVFAGAEEDYAISCATELGSVTVNGRSTGSYTSAAKEAAARSVTARTSVGSIALRFDG